MSTVGISTNSAFQPFPTSRDNGSPDARIFDTGPDYLRSEMRFVLSNESAEVSRLINALCGHMERFVSCTEKCRNAIATSLEEALANAMFHGNLEVSSKLREYGNGEPFYRLARRRQRQRPYRDRRIFVSAQFAHGRAEFVVRDEGPGFDPSKIPNPFDPSNAGAVSGRGILMMRGLMDEVVFNAKGNEVRLTRQLHHRPHA